MKLNMNTLTKWSAAIILSGAGMIACTDLGDLENRVNDLESRIEALESQLPALNATLEALGGIVQDGAVITSIDYNEEEGQYEFTLSGDDKTYTLKNGSVGNVPTIGINDDGNWTVTVNGTTTVLTLGEGGEPASAKAVVPQFKIDEDGYWTVSTDGETYNRVTDPDGNPVPATGTSGSNIFDDVKLENGVLKIWLAGETEPIEVKVVSADEFSCVIKYDGEVVDYDTPIEFQPNKTLTFDVTMVGVESTIISKPQGWSAELSGTTLTVKAPATVSSAQTATKISANTEKDITIHAISTDGLSVFAKMQVELLPGAKPTIEVAVTGDASSYNSVSFTLSNAENMTSYKYLLYPKGGTVPTELAFSSAASHEATSAPSAPITLDETSDGQKVTYNSSYVLYVMPVNTTAEGYTINGEIVSATAATKTATTYYELYQAGQNITIAGKEYTPETLAELGNITHITTENASSTTIANNGGTYFIDSDVTLENTTAGGWNKVRLIGNTIGTRTHITMTSHLAMNTANGNVEFFNLEFTDPRNSGNYLFTSNFNGAFEYLAFDNCKFNMRSISFFSSGLSNSNVRSVNNLAIENCIFEFPATASGNLRMLALTGAITAETHIASMRYKNNIFYCAEGTAQNFQLAFTSNGPENPITIDRLTIENNTFVNLTPTTVGIVQTRNISDLVMRNNLFWIEHDNASYYVINCTGNAPIGSVCAQNIGYSANSKTEFTTFTGNKGWSGAENISALSSDPYSGGTFNLKDGIFIPNSSNLQYGSTIGR